MLVFLRTRMLKTACKGAGNVAVLVECLPNRLKVLGSVPNTVGSR